MARGGPDAKLTSEQQEQLQGMAASRSLPAGLVTRVRIVLMSAEGQSNLAIAIRLRLSRVTVGQRRRRFLQQGIAGLDDELRPGRLRSNGGERGRDWFAGPWKPSRKTARARASGKSRVRRDCPSRRWSVFGNPSDWSRTAATLQALQRSIFLEKVRDTVGLYLHPPEGCSGSVRGRDEPASGA